MLWLQISDVLSTGVYPRQWKGIPSNQEEQVRDRVRGVPKDSKNRIDIELITLLVIETSGLLVGRDRQESESIVIWNQQDAMKTEMIALSGNRGMPERYGQRL